MVTGRLDVGGTEGMQQYNIEAFGSADSQKSFSIDGLKTNWGGGGGGSTMQYYGFEMYEEYNMQTASGTAESDVSGVYMNMVTKSGGNRFSSDHNFYFMNDALQTENIDDALRARLGSAPGQKTGAAGNPIDISYDWSSTLGGPVKRDKVWFFGATRWWRLDQFQIGALNPDGSQAIDDNRIENYMGKGTWQVAAETKASFMFNRNLKYRFHRREADFSEDQRRYCRISRRRTTLRRSIRSRVTGRLRRAIRPHVGRLSRRVSEGRDADRHRDSRHRRGTPIQRRDRAIAQSEPPVPGQCHAQLLRRPLRPGTHDFKVGTQLSWEKMQYDRIRNGDLFLELSDGVALRAQFANTPVDSDHRLQTWAAFCRIAGWSGAPRSITECEWMASRRICRRSPVRRGHLSASDRLPRRPLRLQSERGAAHRPVLRSFGRGRTA